MSYKYVDITGHFGHFRFHFLTGSLLKKENARRVKPNTFNAIEEKNYDCVVNPYKIQSITYPSTQARVGWYVKLYAQSLARLASFSFYLTYLFTYIPLIHLPDSRTAAQVFNAIYATPYQKRTMCLARTFFIMATSLTFRKHGTAFIGVFLPGKKMHAWVIESGYNPDPADQVWIMYQPVAIMSK